MEHIVVTLKLEDFHEPVGRERLEEKFRKLRDHNGMTKLCLQTSLYPVIIKDLINIVTEYSEEDYVTIHIKEKNKTINIIKKN